MDVLAVTLLLATANKALLDFIAAPIRRRYPDVDLWWFDYVALVTGLAMGWFAGINVFLDMIGNPILGRVLTALLVGGGAALINSVMGSPQLPATGTRGAVGPQAPRRPRGW